MLLCALAAVAGSFDSAFKNSLGYSEAVDGTVNKPYADEIMPVLSVEPGEFSAPFNLQLTLSNGAAISRPYQVVYTTDGNEPTMDNANNGIAQIYTSSGIDIPAATTTVKIQVFNLFTPAGYLEATYTYVEEPSTDVPAVFYAHGQTGIDGTEITNIDGDYSSNSSTNTHNAFDTFKSGSVSLTIGGGGSSKALVDNKGLLRVYADNTLTFSVPEGSTISEIKFTQGSDKFTSSNSKVSVGNWNAADAIWTGEANEVIITKLNKGRVEISKIEVSYTKGEAPTVSKPTFSIASGWVATGTEVTISCETEGASIYYTLDDTEPTAESTLYEGAIAINNDVTLKAIAAKDGISSSVVSEDYKTYPANSAEAPLTVTQALSLIDAGFSTDIEVYIKGIVSEVTEVSTEFGNATYKIKGDDEAEITVFRGKYLNGDKFTAEDQIMVDDKVVVLGKIKDYKGTKEVDSNNTLISIEKPEPAPEYTVAIAGVFNSWNPEANSTKEITDNCATITVDEWVKGEFSVIVNGKYFADATTLTNGAWKDNVGVASFGSNFMLDNDATGASVTFTIAVDNALAEENPTINIKVDYEPMEVPIVEKEYYLVGDYSNDSWTTRKAFIDQEDGSYMLTVESLSGAFKIVGTDKTDDWTMQWGISEGISLDSEYDLVFSDGSNGGAPNIKFATDEVYTDVIIILTPGEDNALKMKVTGAPVDVPVEKEFYLVGDYSNDDWTTRTVFNKQEDGTYTLSIASLSGAFKIVGSEDTTDWTKQWGLSEGISVDTEYDLVFSDGSYGGAPNIKFATDIEYTDVVITLMPGENNALKMKMTGTAGEIVESDFYIVGAVSELGAWAPASGLKLNKISDTQYEGTVTIESSIEGEAGYFKVVTIGSSTTWYGAQGESAVAVEADKVVTLDGGMDMILPALDKGYKFMVTAADGKPVSLTVTHFSGINGINATDADAEYYNMQGIRVLNPAKGGIYIIRKDGKAVKAVVK